MIRLARSAELTELREIERAAGAAFRDLGMDAVADDDPPSTAELAALQRDGRAWVATDGQDRAVAYLLLAVVDEAAHIEQVSVHPVQARRGLGRELIERAISWAEERGFAALTLTTFAEVPWNAPYYARLGFRVLAEDELGPDLRRLRRREADVGLDAWPRVAMSRRLTPLRASALPPPGAAVEQP